MSENRISEGKIVFLENCTAASNMVAGTMVQINTGANTVYSYHREATGANNTGGAWGVRFLGVLDYDVSANQVGIGVHTEGVFEFQLASSITTAASIGHPVWGCNSGNGLLVTTEGTGASGAANDMATGMFPIGTVVGVTSGGTSGSFVRVKIRPGAYRWGALLSSTGTHMGNNFPPSI